MLDKKNSYINQENLTNNPENLEFFIEERNCIKFKSTPGNLNEDLIIKFAETREEYEKAFHLVYMTYLKEGVIEPNNAQLRITLYHALPTTKVLIVKKNNEVIATLTILLNSALGLPIYSIYGNELSQFKQDKLLEIGSFASDPNFIKYLRTIMVKFLIIVKHCTYVLDSDYVCIAANPKHKKFYEKVFLFEKTADFKYYNNNENNIKKAPSILLISHLKKNILSEEYMKSFNKNLCMYLRNEINLETGKMTEDELRYFFIKETNIFKNTEKNKIKYISNLYSTYDFNRIIN